MNRIQWIWRGLLVAVLAGGPGHADGAAPKPFLQDLLARTWTKEEGRLPDNSVTAVLQTRDGYLWVGTWGGLARFDGVRFVLFAPPGAAQTLHVTALCEDSEGRLWVGTQGAGLLRYANGQLSWFEANASLSDQTISSIAAESAGSLWVGTPQGLNRVDGLQVTRFGARDGLPNEFVSSVHVARSGSVWITTTAGMCQYTNGHVLPFPIETDSAGRNPLHLGFYEDRQGNQWAYGDTYLVRFEKDKGVGKRLNYFRSGDTSSGRLWSLCEGRDGQLWVGASGASGQGLYCFAEDRLVQMTLRTGRLSSDVRALFEDTEGNLWLGTHGGGLIRLQPRSLRVLDASVGLPADSPGCLAVGAEGRLLVGFEHGGLYGEVADRFEPETGESSWGVHNLVSSLCAAPDSSLWVASPGAGLYRLKGHSLVHYTTADGLSDNVILALATEPDGTVWAGTMSGGLHRFANGVLTSFGVEAGLPGQALTALLPSRSGGLWVGTDGGQVLREEGGQFRRLNEAGFLTERPIRAIYEDAHNRLWLGSAGGLVCLAGERRRSWEQDPGSVDNPVIGILGSEDGDLWFAKGKAIYHLTAADVDRWLSDQSPLRPELFFESESSATAGAGYGWPRAVRSPDGRLWFAIAGGVVTFDPRGVEPNPAPPPVRLEAILVNGKPLAGVASDVNSAPPSAAPLRLPSDLRSLEIYFTAFCFTAPERVRFRHKLENSDPEWVQGGAERYVRYGRLPYGDYTFRVTAATAPEAWNKAGAGFSFRVPAPPWRAAWALTLYGCVAAGLVAGAARMVSNRRLRAHLAHLAQEQAMQRERMRIAQDMHDEIGSKLTKISFMSERAKGELSGQHAVASKLDVIAHTSRDLLQSLDEIVWAVNPHNDTLEHMAAYLVQYANEYLQNTAVECELQIPHNLPHQPLSAETRHNLFLAFEEVLNNSLKHGRPSCVRIDMTCGARRFEIAVRDNGCGFESASLDTAHPIDGSRRPLRVGNGLRNMRQRLEEVGGQCTIRSRPGAGAAVTLSIPLGAAD